MKLYQELLSAYPDGHVSRMNLSAAVIYLAARCVMTQAGTYWVRSNLGVWAEYKSAKAARMTLEQNWAGGPHSITADDVMAFFQDGQAPVVYGAMKVPSSAAPLIEIGGRVYVNTWIEGSIIEPDIDVLDDQEVRTGITLLLRMIRESLCAKQGEKTLDEMLLIANGNDPGELEFRVLMMFLAAPLQEIGRNLQINVWLLGETNGVGKGLLNSLMNTVYGPANCALCNDAEIAQGGWNDFLTGKLWVNVNEMNTQNGKIDWNSFLKQNTTEEFLSIRQRSNDSRQVLNFGNWMIYSNDELPIGFDPKDRRHFLIATTDDLEKAKLSLALFGWMRRKDTNREHLLKAFVAILNCQKLDETLLERAAETPIKREAQEAGSNDGEVEYWLANDLGYPRDEWQRAHDYEELFARFYHRTTRSPRRFGGKLSKLARKKLISKRAFMGSLTQPGEYLIPSSRYPAGSQNAERPAAANVFSITLPQRQR